MPDPDVLLPDESLSLPDAQVRDQQRGGIVRARKAVGTAAILATHDRAEAPAIPESAVPRQGARIEQGARSEALHDRPATEASATFIGRRDRITLTHVDGMHRLGHFFGRLAAGTAPSPSSCAPRT